MNLKSCWYEGSIHHARQRPIRHTFRYPAFYFAVDLDELERLDQRLLLFGHNRRAVVSIRDRDYLGQLDGSLKSKLVRHLRCYDMQLPIERVVLLTTPRVFGHTFNPVSFYYCYGAQDELVYVVAEVNNTVGEGHLYLLNAAADGTVTSTDTKAFHVSPFNDVSGDYTFAISPLSETLRIGIELVCDGTVEFSARLDGRRRPLSNAQLARLMLRYPLTNLMTLPRIAWQAFRLHYGFGLPVHPTPRPSSDRTFRATYPAYLRRLDSRATSEAQPRRPASPRNQP